MRKIKFRMWNPLGRDGRGRYHYGKQAMECLTQQSIGLYDHEKDGCIFEQFTGLRDKNGEEIYEGDILNLLNYYNTQVNVIFFEGSFTISGQFQFIPKMSEVIGNIHEKQELAP